MVCFIQLNLLQTISVMLILTNIVPLHQFANNSKTERVDVFSISTEAHLTLPKPHCVFSCWYFIVDFHLALLHTLGRKDQLNGQNSNAFRPLAHVYTVGHKNQSIRPSWNSILFLWIILWQWYSNCDQRSSRGVSRATLKGSASKLLYNEIGKYNFDYYNWFFLFLPILLRNQSWFFFQCELRIMKFWLP